MINLTIPDVPPSVNHYWIARGNRRFISKKGKEWKQLVKVISAKCKHLEGKLEMTVDVYFTDKRRRDIDNCAKAVLDSLEGIAYKDDAQIHKLTMQKLNGDTKKTVITIKEI